MKKFFKNFIFVLIFIAGLSLLLYPYISNKWNAYRQSKLITEYDEAIEEIKEEINYSKEWESAHAYNAGLLPSILPDSFAIAAAKGEPAEEYMADKYEEGESVFTDNVVRLVEFIWGYLKG